jgi:hypothetical protein
MFIETRDPKERFAPAERNFPCLEHIALLQSAGITCDGLAIDIRPLCGQADFVCEL